MDRNNRYARRGGFPVGSSAARSTAEHRQMSASTVPAENCLCDRQPIALAMSYVKEQPFDGVYDACRAWQNGTLFPSLFMPYCIGGRKR